MQFTLKEPKYKLPVKEAFECTITTEMLKKHRKSWKGYLDWDYISDLDHILFSVGWMRTYRWRYLSNGDLYTTYVVPR